MADNSIPQTRVCTQCKQEKPLTQFEKRKNRPAGVLSECKACQNLRKQRRVSANPDKYKLKRKASYEKKRERLITEGASIDRYEKTCPQCQKLKPVIDFHRNRLRHDGRDVYCKSCQSKIRKRDRQVRPDIYKQRRHQQYIGNKEAAALETKIRRARLNNSEGEFTYDDLLQMYEDQHGLCAYCGVRIFWHVKWDVNVDHIHPLSKGGSSWPANLALCCRYCNSSKNNRLLTEWNPCL